MKIKQFNTKLKLFEVFSLSSYDALVEKLIELTNDNKGHSFSLYIEGEILELREESLN